MRGGIRISKISEETNHIRENTRRIDWIDQFADKIAQVSQLPTIVESARARNHSIFDQINSILTKHPIANSVEEVVLAYQKQCGLNEWLKQSEEEVEIKVAQEVNSSDPFSQLNPQLKDDVQKFITNKIQSRHGNIQVPAVIHDILQLFKNRGLDGSIANDPVFKKYISDQIIEIKRRNPNFTDNSNLGKLDQGGGGAETGMFDNLQPAK